MRSDVSRAQFTNDYSAEWYTFDDGTGNLKLHMQLTIQNVDISGWSTTDGTYGYWLGIGFG